MVVTEEGSCLFVYRVLPESTEKWTSHTVDGELFLNILSYALQKYLKNNE